MTNISDHGNISEQVTKYDQFQTQYASRLLQPIYGTVLHDSKVAQSWVILLPLWQVTVVFWAYQKGSDQLLSHRLH